MKAPCCWRCVDSADGPRRPNRAIYLVKLITGETSFECERHAVLSVSIGGECWALSDLPPLASDRLRARELTVADVRRGRDAAAFLRQPELSNYQLAAVMREVLPTVLVQMLQVGLTSGVGGTGPPLAQKAEAPLQQQRRLPSASPVRKKRG